MSTFPTFHDLPAPEVPTSRDLPAPEGELRTTGTTAEREPWTTPEGIDVPPLYTEQDLEQLDFLDTVPGWLTYMVG